MMNVRQVGISQLPQMGRARGLIAVLESVRQQGRGLGPLSTPVVGHGRAKYETLLLAGMKRTRNCSQTPNPVSYQAGRGRGLGCPPYAIPPCTQYCWSWQSYRRNPGPHLCSDTPLHIPHMMSRCLCPQRNNPIPPPLEAPPGPPPLGSPRSSESGYEADSHSEKPSYPPSNPMTLSTLLKHAKTPDAKTPKRWYMNVVCPDGELRQVTVSESK